jgi:CheY-like chemotaxis protein
VDDEPYNLFGLKVILELADPTGVIKEYVDEASNGLDALKAVKLAYEEGVFSYGLIIMDCSMPIMDGYEATEKIRNFIRGRRA